jgi:hypothetical protein
MHTTHAYTRPLPQLRPVTTLPADAPPRTEPQLTAICARCGKAYRLHHAWDCPDARGTFQDAPLPLVMDADDAHQADHRATAHDLARRLRDVMALLGTGAPRTQAILALDVLANELEGE